jgi:hypothetical protein
MGFEVHKGCCHFAPVAKFERPLTQPATGHNANGVGGATIDFDEGDEALAVAASRLLYAEAAAPEHCQTDAQNLSCAEVSVGNPGFFEKIIEGGLGFRHILMLDRRAGRWLSFKPDDQVLKAPVSTLAAAPTAIHQFLHVDRSRLVMAPYRGFLKG